MEQFQKNIQAKLTKLKALVLRRDLLLATLIACMVIALGVFFGWYNNKVVLTNPTPLAHYSSEPNNPLSFLSNWDGPDYLRIAVHGYQNVNDTNFFPLYPFLTHLLNYIIDSPLYSALIISWVSFVGAIYVYLKLLKHLFSIKDNSEAARGLIFFIFFPTAIFMLATYTEALFAFFALSAIYTALKKQYLAAGLFAILCTLTHITGIFVVLLIAMILWEQKAKLREWLIAPAIGSLGLITYMAYLWNRFNAPLAFITSQKNHGWLESAYSNLFNSGGVLSVFFFILILVGIYYWWSRRKSFALYLCLFVSIPIIGKQFGGFNRYSLMAFPLQFMFYDFLKNKRTAYTYAAVLLGLGWAYFLFQYSGGYVGG